MKRQNLRDNGVWIFLYGISSDTSASFFSGIQDSANQWTPASSYDHDNAGKQKAS